MRYGHVMLVGALGIYAAGCGAHIGSSVANAQSPQASAPLPVAPVAVASSDSATVKKGEWIGTGAESDALLVGDAETTLGVWVDAPEAAPSREHVPVDLALVIDTSGSMEGAKIDNARLAAKTLVEALKDGDIVSIDRFDDDAKPVAPPTVITKESRQTIERKIDALATGGSTNLFDGLALGEAHVARAPETHAVRRVVVISDGQANIGPSSPAELGQLAERGVRFHAQVTSLGVGNDYSEQTLNALAVRSSGRLYHIDDPKEMAGMLRHELDLLQSTVASDAFVEVVPAPGVQLISADGIRGDMSSDGSMKIPLGTLFGGQHREALVRLRVSS
ncbi:MAG: VWA domain-containing protein, partial [Polyangiaceae bacterium]